MKKLLIVLLALTVVGVFVVAQDAPAASLSVGAWGRGFYVPFASSDGGSTTFVEAGPAWGGVGTGARVGVSFTGTSENIGFSWNPGVDGSKMNAVCDNADIWVKLNPMVKVVVGMYEGDTLRGNFDDFGDYIAMAGYMPGKDSIFTRFYPKAGMVLELTPAEGVFIGAALDSKSSKADLSSAQTMLDAEYAMGFLTKDEYDLMTADLADAQKAVVANYQSVKDAFNAIQVGAGYTIPNIGMARFQYIGNADTTAKGKVQGAFNYTGTKGLGLDIGVTYPLNSDYQTVLALGGAYTADALAIGWESANSFMGASGAKFNTNTMVQIQYTVQAPYAVGADAGIHGMDAAGTKGYIDIFPFVKAGYDKGYLKAGFCYSSPLDSGAKAMYAVPIEIEYGF